MTGSRNMMAGLGVRIALVSLLLIAGVTGIGLLVGALVALIEPLVGMAGALAIVGLGHFLLAFLILLRLGALARAARGRRDAAASMVGLAELVLRLLPRTQLLRLRAGLAAGVGLAALIVLILRPESDRENG